MSGRERLALALVLAGAVAGVGLGFRAETVSETDRRAEAAADGLTGGLAAETAEALAAGMERLFGQYRQPTLPPGGMPGVADEDELSSGRSTFAVKCAQCHGVTGAADTGTARLLKPRPRSFRSGTLKFTSTPAGQPPLRADLERVIREGIPTTSMAGFPTLPEKARRELASYTQYLLMRGATEAAALTEIEGLGGAAGHSQVSEIVESAYEAVARAWEQAEAAPVPPPSDDPAVRQDARAEELYRAAACLTCHGEDGSGKGPVAWANDQWLLRDAWGNEARPRAFADGVWFGGDAPEDLYRRIAHGVKGTPMPPSAGSLSPEEIWALVRYVQGFSQEED